MFLFPKCSKVWDTAFLLCSLGIGWGLRGLLFSWQGFQSQSMPSRQPFLLLYSSWVVYGVFLGSTAINLFCWRLRGRDRWSAWWSTSTVFSNEYVPSPTNTFFMSVKVLQPHIYFLPTNVVLEYLHGVSEHMQDVGKGGPCMGSLDRERSPKLIDTNWSGLASLQEEKSTCTAGEYRSTTL